MLCWTGICNPIETGKKNAEDKTEDWASGILVGNNELQLSSWNSCNKASDDDLCADTHCIADRYNMWIWLEVV